MIAQRKANEINDGIDRYFEYPGYILDLLDTAEVQRMRGIIQNGFSSISYPNLTHSRHVHLIGTVKKALEMWKRAVSNTPDIIDTDSVKVYERCIASAALLHDIGHSPFSHDLETLINNFTKKSHEQVAAEMIVGEYSLHDFYKIVPASIVPHKVRDQIINVFSRMQRISGILTNYGIPFETVAQIIDKKRSSKKGDNIGNNHFLRECIDGKVIDADKLDYLQRDRMNAGITETSFEPQGIIASLGLIRWNDGIHVGISDKGIEMVNQLLATRQYLYSRCYTHKTVLKIQAMVYEACKRVLTSLGDERIQSDYGSSLHLLNDAQFEVFILTHAENASNAVQLYTKARYNRSEKYEIAYGIEANAVSGLFDKTESEGATILKSVLSENRKKKSFDHDPIRDAILERANIRSGKKLEDHEVIVYFPYGSPPEIEKKRRDFELYIFDQDNPANVYLASERLHEGRCTEALTNAFRTFCRPQTSYYFMVLCPKEIVERVRIATQEYITSIQQQTSLLEV